MDDLQRLVKNTIVAYPNSLNKYSNLKSIMADVFKMERNKCKAFCVGYIMGIIDACRQDHAALRSIYREYIDDYEINKDDAVWAISTWCEVFDVPNYSQYFLNSSQKKIVDDMFGDSILKIENQIKEHQAECEKKRLEQEEINRRDALIKQKIDQRYKKMADSIDSSNEIAMSYISLFKFLVQKQIWFDSITLKYKDELVNISNTSKKMVVNVKTSDGMIGIQVHSSKILFPKLDSVAAKEKICMWFDDSTYSQLVITGLKSLISFAAENNCEYCDINEKGCFIKQIKLDMRTGKLYHGNQLLVKE